MDGRENNIPNHKQYGEKFYYLTYQDKNLVGYIFKKFFTIKKIRDGLLVFRQENILFVCVEA